MDEEYVINGAAWDKLDQALFTSSLITEEEHKRGRLEDEQHMYPISRKETEQMEQLLNEAEELADDPNEENYVERLSMLRNVVDWSKSRHKSWSVKIIIGALISAWLLNGAEKKGGGRYRKCEENSGGSAGMGLYRSGSERGQRKRRMARQAF